MIEILNIHKSFNDTSVLKDVSFKFETGKTNLVIGQSGSGKSVLTKCIVGLHDVDNGQVLYDGRDMQSMSNRQRKTIFKEIGMLFQGSALFDSMTVEENVIFPLSMFSKMTKEEMRERANFCLKRVELFECGCSASSSSSPGHHFVFSKSCPPSTKSFGNVQQA